MAASSIMVLPTVSRRRRRCRRQRPADGDDDGLRCLLSVTLREFVTTECPRTELTAGVVR